jgi:hypothetical protein
MYYVYLHTSPDGKVYVGQSKKPIQRWGNGSGYTTNETFTKAIEYFGWENIKHEIIATYESPIEAAVCEAVLIFHLNSEDKNVGYNQTTIKKDVLKAYANRTSAIAHDFDKALAGKNIFEKSGLPVDACKIIIDQWIFDKKKRAILKDRLIDGMTFDELKEKYKLSVRQLKNIVSECSRDLEEHLP